VPATQITRARTQLAAGVKSLQPGRWEVPHDEAEHSRLGCLMLEGVLAREIILAGKTCTELLGEGDMTQPWLPAHEEGLVRYRVRWDVLAPTKLAVLDDSFARMLSEWPQVMGALLERAVRRTHRMSIHAALQQLSPVETRLLVLFWHLAERWGRVTSAGVCLGLRLSHKQLGQLVGGRRASVTTALRHMTESGRVLRRDDGTWLLRGSPPDELSQINWHQAAQPTVGALA